ncbi:MAG: hypothetical protein ACLQIB_44635 [Isosphaeraceae bacterium]
MNREDATDGVLFILHPSSFLFSPRPTFVRSSTIARHVGSISEEISGVAAQVLLERTIYGASDFTALASPWFPFLWYIFCNGIVKTL